jgi:Dynamin family
VDDLTNSQNLDSATSELLNALNMAIGLLELPPTDPLRQDVNAVGQHIDNSSFRIAVFAPFNYGKSTLLNALLGERTLPIDLIPTTGAAIVVRYGSDLQTRISLSNGTEIQELGTEVLSRFAILNDNRRMREDVRAVEVCCPHPVLQTGIEFVDLPGTDDREAQDALVKNQLLTADLVVQVLDGRKLMTLQERETLRDWLLDRGIETVIFVVNFLNLLEPDDQKQVMNRLRFVAESFRAQLPPGVSNLYRVDALPALRARLKGDGAAAQAAGLSMLESALQTIAQAQLQRPEVKLLRLRAIAQQVKQALQIKINQVTAEVTSAEQTDQRTQIQRRALTLIRQGFADSSIQLKTWLMLPNLLTQYEVSAVAALRRFEFSDWETNALKPDWLTQKRSLTDWIDKACDFLETPRPAALWVAFPDEPQFVLPNSSPTADRPFSPNSEDITPTAIATGVGWILGGPLGAAVLGGASYVLNQTVGQQAAPQNRAEGQSDRTSEQLEQCYVEAIRAYFDRFSAIALAALNQYEKEAQKILSLDVTGSPSQTAVQHRLTLMQATLNLMS